MSRSPSAFIIIAHGSKARGANEAFFRFIDEFRNAYPDRHVQPAFLECSDPRIPEAISTCLQKGFTDICVLPLMFFPGRHVEQDIPGMIREVKAAHPQLQFHYGGPLCEDAGMLELLARRMQALSGLKEGSGSD